MLIEIFSKWMKPTVTSTNGRLMELWMHRQRRSQYSGAGREDLPGPHNKERLFERLETILVDKAQWRNVHPDDFTQSGILFHSRLVCPPVNLKALTSGITSVEMFSLKPSDLRQGKLLMKTETWNAGMYFVTLRGVEGEVTGKWWFIEERLSIWDRGILTVAFWRMVIRRAVQTGNDGIIAFGFLPIQHFSLTRS